MGSLLPTVTQPFGSPLDKVSSLALSQDTHMRHATTPPSHSKVPNLCSSKSVTATTVLDPQPSSFAGASLYFLGVDQQPTCLVVCPHHRHLYLAAEGLAATISLATQTTLSCSLCEA